MGPASVEKVVLIKFQSSLNLLNVITPGGKLDSKWEELLLEYSDRFMAGVDTYSPNRWLEFDSVVRQIRGWLVQLPKDVALDLAYRNANRLWKSQEK